MPIHLFAALIILAISSRSSTALPASDTSVTSSSNGTLGLANQISPSSSTPPIFKVDPTVLQPRQTPQGALYNAVLNQAFVPAIGVQDAVPSISPTASPSLPVSLSVPQTLATSVRLAPVYQTCTVAQSFALTFDDGPGPLAKQLDEVVYANHVRASYFLNGNNFGCIYDHGPLLLARYNAGQLLGSHTWSHPHLTQCSHREIHFQLELLEHAFIRILGVRPLWFRPPYGEYNDLVLQVLAERNYKGLVLWTDDSQDSTSPVSTPQERIEAYGRLRERSNILNHETENSTVLEVIPIVVPQLVGRGLQLITVPECLNIPSDPKEWYEYVGPPSPRDPSWTCEGTPGSEQIK